MSKHTPGPWRLGRNNHAVVCDSTDGTHCSESEINYYGGALVCESVKSEANARLIAQAPRLLESLKAVLPYIESVCDCGPDGEGWQSGELMCLIAECNDAIAAATETKE